MFQKFVPIVNCIFCKALNASWGKCKLIQAWVALGKFLEEFVHLAVNICHQDTLPNATPSFQVGKNFENRKKHQRRRIAWVGQADFGKLELNNRNHGGKCQHLSAKRDQFETRSIWINRWNFLTFAFSLWTDEATTTFRHFNVFAKTFYGRAIHKLVILRYFNVFTGTLYRRANYNLPRQVPSQVCYSPS